MPRHDWRPQTKLGALEARAQLYASLRRFFAEAGVMEVETPLASHAGLTDPALESWRTAWSSAKLRPETRYSKASRHSRAW